MVNGNGEEGTCERVEFDLSKVCNKYRVDQQIATSIGGDQCYNISFFRERGFTVETKAVIARGNPVSSEAYWNAKGMVKTICGRDYSFYDGSKKPDFTQIGGAYPVFEVLLDWKACELN